MGERKVLNNLNLEPNGSCVSNQNKVQYIEQSNSCWGNKLLTQIFLVIMLEMFNSERKGLKVKLLL